MIVLILIFAFCLPVHAQVFSSSEEQVLYQRDKSEESKRSLREPDSEPIGKKKKVIKKEHGNLPSHYKTSSEIKNIAVLVPKGKGTIPGLHVGNMLTGIIPHSVIAFPDEKAPVLANVTSGKFKGAVLVGFSRLEKNSKRVMIEFTHMTHKKLTAEVKAVALTESGQPGFEGEYHSQELKYFTGDFLSSMTAAYFDSQVPRFQTLFGQVREVSPEAALKTGLAAGAMSSAERFRQKLKQSPEFCDLNAGFKIVVMFI